jgi:hypothetical protein
MQRGAGRPCVAAPHLDRVLVGLGEAGKYREMERPRGIEPPPTAWQAVVRPLYYGRISVGANVLFYSTPPITGQGPGGSIRSETITGTHIQGTSGPSGFLTWSAAATRRKGASVNLEDAGGTNDRRLFLPLRKSIGALAVDIDPGKLFTVLIVDGNLPVAVLAPPVFFEPAVFAGSRRRLTGFFGHRVL